MDRAVLLACLPWLGLLAGSVVCLRLLVRLSGSRPEPGRLLRLHADQSGSAQSLSFVLTLPFFVMIILFIVQVSQLMIGTIVVHYAAFAAARSAIVWIPAWVSPLEAENCISSYEEDFDAPDQIEPMIDPGADDYGPSDGGLTYIIHPDPASLKYRKIHSAAVMACMPICPSRRDLELPPLSDEDNRALGVFCEAFGSMASWGSASEGAVKRRLATKLAYSAEHTSISIRFYHSNWEPELRPHFQRQSGEYLGGFADNELGWQDPITVRVTHNLALLPGPGRFLSRVVRRADGSPDSLSQHIKRAGNVYVYPLSASATLGNEGEKSVKRYAHDIDSIGY